MMTGRIDLVGGEKKIKRIWFWLTDEREAEKLHDALLRDHCLAVLSRRMKDGREALLLEYRDTPAANRIVETNL